MVVSTNNKCSYLPQNTCKSETTAPFPVWYRAFQVNITLLQLRGALYPPGNAQQMSGSSPVSMQSTLSASDVGAVVCCAGTT